MDPYSFLKRGHMVFTDLESSRTMTHKIGRLETNLGCWLFGGSRLMNLLKKINFLLNWFLFLILIGSKIQPQDQLVISGLDPSLHHNLSIISHKTCVAFDPASGKPINSLCSTHRGSVCLFPKGDHLLYDILKLY